VDATTICGTDLHILAGDVPEVRPGRILGHEAFDEAYDVFARTADTSALKVVLT
jgi:alcohol dehydrogenase